MTTEDSKLIRVSAETWNFLKEFSSRSGVDMKDVLTEFAIQGQKALNDLDAGKILYLFSYDLKNKMVHLYLGNACKLGIPLELPESEVLAAFNYRRINGAIVDLNEHPEMRDKA